MEMERRGAHADAAGEGADVQRRGKVEMKAFEHAVDAGPALIAEHKIAQGGAGGTEADAEEKLANDGGTEDSGLGGAGEHARQPDADLAHIRRERCGGVAAAIVETFGQVGEQAGGLHAEQQSGEDGEIDADGEAEKETVGTDLGLAVRRNGNGDDEIVGGVVGEGTAGQMEELAAFANEDDAGLVEHGDGGAVALRAEEGDAGQGGGLRTIAGAKRAQETGELRAVACRRAHRTRVRPAGVRRPRCGGSGKNSGDPCLEGWRGVRSSGKEPDKAR